MYDFIEHVHKALGIESTWAFVLVAALSGALIAALVGGCFAWVIDAAYKNSAEYKGVHPSKQQTAIGISGSASQTATVLGRSDQGLPANVPTGVRTRAVEPSKQPEARSTTTATPPITLQNSPGSAVSFNQQGGITAGTINLGPSPPPPLNLTMGVSDQNGDDAFKYQKLVTVTVNVMLSPVAIGILCDAPVENISVGTRHGGVFMNEHLLVEGNVAFVYFEGHSLNPHDELYVTLKSSKPFSVIEVKPAIIKGLND